MQHSTQSQFECNVCFDPASNPVVTKCGHLFCWSCLLSWLQRAHDCPVCKAGVTRDEVIPIFGRGETAASRDAAVAAEPRPVPERVEAGPRIGRDIMRDSSSFSMGIGAFPFIPFVGFSYSSGGHPPLPVSGEERRQRVVTQFFIFIGAVLLILISSS